MKQEVEQNVDGFRLSPQQRHLWRVRQEAGGDFARALCAVTLEGALDRSALRRALKRAVERNEILRTSFLCLPSMSIPLQVIAPGSPLGLREIDLSRALPRAAAGMSLHRSARVEALFDFLQRTTHGPDTAPTLVACLVTSSPQEHELVLSLPALCADMAGLRNLVHEIARCYGACKNGGALPEVPVQYADVSDWQNDLLVAEETRAGRVYWSELGSRVGNGTLVLPFERNGTRSTELDPQQVRRILDRDLMTRLRSAVRPRGGRDAAFLLAAWQVLLWRLAGETPVTIRTLHDGRRYEELEGALGLFARYLPLPGHLRRDLPFTEAVDQVEKLTEEASRWQESFTWEILLGEAKSRAAPFGVAGFEYFPADACPETAGVSFRLERFWLQTDRFHLKLACSPCENHLEAVFHFDGHRFRRPDIELLGARFERLLEAAAAQPTAAIGRFDLLSKAERAEVLVEFNATTPAAGEDRSVHELFERQVRRTPDAVAVVFEGSRLTYSEMNSRANRLARNLLELGVGRESPVALCCERSLELVVGMMAILKAGAVYVPLDPALPRQRQELIVQDLQVRVLVSQRRLERRLPRVEGRVLSIDDPTSLPAEGCANLDLEVPSQSLVYLMFTSGSTGRPKGVALEHRQLVNYVRGVAERLGLPVDGNYATVTTFAADLGNTMVFPSLCRGGCLHVLSQERVSDPARFREYFTERRVDCLKIVPSHLQALLSVPHAEQLLPRQCLVLGGEVLPPSLAEKLLQIASSCRVFNHYGPTETAVGALTHPLERVSGAVPPLGRPLSGYEIYLLDPELEAVPRWVLGELFIGGSGLARGYFGRPRTSAERFIPHPFSAGPGRRLYRTGDLARRSGREIEFVGRCDHQIKIRGFRVELGEIEAALTRHPAIEGTVVTARAHGEGEKRLVAYVVFSGEPVDPGRLRETLTASLPDYMVPAVFAPLPALPRTSNGKVDRQALPEPPADSDRPIQAPRGPTEELLAQVWAEVLGLERVGVHEDFFELGGHSLTATRLVSRLRQALDVELSLTSLFENPTIAGLAALVEHGEARLPAIEPIPRRGRLPVSFSQQRLWFIDQLDSDSATYHLPVVLQLRGALDVGALAATFSEIVRRHEVLRTTFLAVDGQPWQVVEAPRPHVLRVVDLRSLVPERREGLARQLADDEIRRPFDLAAGPLLHSLLLRPADDEHILVLTLHHIVGDRWSMGILVDECVRLYRAFVMKVPSALPELPIQYADFAFFQRRWMQDEVLKTQLAYWRRQLGGAPPLLELPSDRPRPPVESHAGVSLAVELPAELTGELRRLSLEQAVTPFMSLLAALQVLLGRYSGQDDISVGTPIAGRRLLETEGLIGCFVNTLVMRTRPRLGNTFQEVLGEVRRTVLEAYTHQDLPFERLVEELEPERSLSHSPLFQVMFAFQNIGIEDLKLAGLEVTSLDVDTEKAKFDLTLSLAESDEGLAGSLEYSRDLFDTTTMVRMMGQWKHLLGGVAQKPGRCISELLLPVGAGRHQLLVSWNDTQARSSRDRSIAQQFDARAHLHRDAIALICGEEQLSYHELRLEAHRLARRLRGLGVGPDVLVGLCVERGPEMVVAILAILEAGGAYVPLDPGLPAKRLTFMARDAALSVLVTTKRLALRLPAVGELRQALEGSVVYLDADPGLPGGERGIDRATSGDDSLAYLIYTSGSTGKPKGVGIPHRSVVNLLSSVRREPGLEAEDVLLAVSTLSFDIAVIDLLLPLVVGARIVVVPSSIVADGRRLALQLEETRTTFMQATPATWRLLIEAGWQGARHLRMISTGEALPRPLRDQLLERGSALWNLYGPTEATVWAAGVRLVPGSEEIPIGRPVENTRLYVLDPYLEPVSAGVPGELYIGGEGVARGYQRRRRLTAQTFLPSPLGPSGERLYRTGDRVRTDAQGRLLFQGRIDRQVKVRGFRIELEEVEVVLRQHPTLAEAAVVIREDAAGENILIAYAVPEPGASVPTAELRAFLGEKLPAYMQPSRFVFLEALPLNPNGKVDRGALPLPEDEQRELSSKFLAPRDWIEEMLCGLWAEVLGVESVSVEDHFFDLGGHSLAATRLISKILRVFDVDLPLDVLFKAPTVTNMAVQIERRMNSREGREKEPIRPVSRREDLELSFDQQRLWLIDQLDPGSSLYQIRNVLRLSGSLDVKVLERSFSEILRRHETLRTAFAVRAGKPVQRIAPPAPVSLPRIDLGALLPSQRESEVRRLVHREVLRPFDLARGPLFRADLIRLAARDHAVLVRMHHIVGDGWSMQILTREMVELYQAFLDRRPSPLPELPIQYADFAHWQRQMLRGEKLAALVAFWQRKLRGASGSELASDLPRPPVRTYTGGRRDLELPADVTRALRDLSRREGVTLFVLLVTAFKVAFRQLAEHDDVIVGINVANRSRAETHGLIGCLVNQLVLRTDLSGDPTFRELLRRVWKVTLDAYAHQDLPFDKLVERLNPKRDLSRSPLFQAKIEFQAAAPEQVELSGLEVRQMEIERPFTHFELLLEIEDRPQGLLCAFRYNRDLFLPSTIERLLGVFHQILQAVLKDAETSLRAIAERQREAAREEQERKEGELAETMRLGLKRIQRRIARKADQGDPATP